MMTAQDKVVIELKHILAAKSLIKNHVCITPIATCDDLDREAGRKVFLKMENQQVTGSFKARGAASFVLHSCQYDRGTANGFGEVFITHSSGNHGLGVAWASRIAAASAHVVMPLGSSKHKKEKVSGVYGADVTICGNTIVERQKAAKKLLARHPNWKFVHPGDWRVLAGQGTIGLEIIEQMERLLINFDSLAAGGGSLISGVSTAIKALRPKIKIIGVQPEAADDAKRSMEKGVLQGFSNGTATTIADGLRTTLHDFTFNNFKDRVNAILSVSEEEIIDAMKFMYEKAAVVIEPSAAVVIAGIMNEEFNKVVQSGPVACVITGGNIQYETFLAHISS